MVLKVVDLSSNNPVSAAATPEADAVIVKATQGTGYVNPSCNQMMALAAKAGKLRGLYHYAGGGNPVSEADYFISNIEGYLNKDVVLVLDWEEYQNSSWGNATWSRAFVNRVHERTGVWCMIYVQASAISQVATCVAVSPLWVAGYRANAASWNVPGFIWSIKPWEYYTLWQFTSGGGLDRSIANLDSKGWKAIARGDKGGSVTPPPVVHSSYSPAGKNLRTIANDVMAGLAGNGEERKVALGKYYNGVQAIISSKDPSVSLAAEVKAGKYGNGDERKRILGEFYDSVQAIINQVSKFYTVQSGQSLSAIGAKLGINWRVIANKNGLKEPFVIYPGQKLKY